MNFFVWMSIGLATFGLAAGYALNARWGAVGIVIAIGLFWLVGQWRNWYPATVIAVTFFIGAAALGAGLGLSAGWMLFSIVAILVAWDLADFSKRLQKAGRVEGERHLQRLHLQRLFLVAGLGLLLGGIALNLQFEFRLGGAILLAGVVIFGLSRVIGQLRRESD
ncbi:MAG: hypothetical protein JW953_06015 [Anaerolineae bacterium]|nr:hypothetical protein [Anaerolineae bacterium]